MKYLDKKQGRKKARENHAIVRVSFKGSEDYGQSGIQGWTYEELAEDAINEFVSDEMKKMITNIEVLEETETE